MGGKTNLPLYLVEFDCNLASKMGSWEAATPVNRCAFCENGELTDET